MTSTDVTSGDGTGNPSAFNAQVIAAVVVAGIIGFIAFWALSAFAPQLGSGRDGGAHALSRGATSYSAIVELLRASGVPVEIDRDDDDDPGLLILTPTMTTSAQDIMDRIATHNTRPLLIVLPRWQTAADPDRTGWVRQGPAQQPQPLLAAAPLGLTVTLGTAPGGPRGNGITLPVTVQTIRGPGLSPIITTADGSAVVARLDRFPQVMILSDADLIANHGVATAVGAQSAVALLMEIAPGHPVFFDVALNGYGANRSLLRLAFTPPFLGLTLCLLAAGLLALWSGFARFGPAWRDIRSVAFGKAGLVSNSAQLIVQAQRVPHFARTYADQVRDVAARRLHAPAGLRGTALETWLDRFPDSRQAHFSRLAGDLAAARTTPEAVARARALGLWRKDILRDSS